jgi:predicted ribosome quality control (RQC) complex YloA/Tae2 family protein
VLVFELDQTIKGAYIDNIYQTNHATLILKLRQPNKPTLHLLIESGKRFHLTSYTHEKPQRPPTFCMALRKYLRNGRVTEILQHEFERLITIKVSAKEGDFQLVCELFGEGNIILVSLENKILHALTYRRMRDRNVLRGETFQYPPSSGKNPYEVNRRDFDGIKKLRRLEIVKALTKFLSIGGLYAEETLFRARIDKNTSCESLTKQQLDRIFNQLQEILSQIQSENVKPHIIIDENGEWIDATPIPLSKYVEFQQKSYKTMNENLDEYYAKVTMKRRVAKASKEVEQELARLKRVFQNQQKTIEKLKPSIERNRKIGDTIYSHFGELQSLFQRIMDQRKNGKSWEDIKSGIEKELTHIPSTSFHSLHPKRLIINVSIGELVIPLNLRRSIQVNAANYYAMAKRSEKKLKGAEKALKETQLKIVELKRQLIKQAEETQKPLSKRRKKVWYEKFRWFHSSEGFLVIGGRDATTNEILIKKHMEPYDVVFHAHIFGAPFVLIKTEGKKPAEQTLREAAQVAASYSRAWREMLGAVNVYWVSPEQVSKSPPPGQYLKKGSFMIQGLKNYIRHVPLQVSIGIKIEKEYPMVIGGPPEAIMKQTNLYVKIVPGNQTSSKLAKQIKNVLAKQVPQDMRRKISEIPLEEIQRFIPLGKGTIKSFKRES